MTALFWISLGLTLYAFAFPLVLTVLARLRSQPSGPGEGNAAHSPEIRPRVSVLVPVCGRADTLAAKLTNLAESTYPIHRFQVLVVLDGPVIGVEEALGQYNTRTGSPLQLQIVQCRRVGKNEALNQGVEQASGEILLFTDADALLAPDAIEHLVAAILPEDIGGGCGRHRILQSKGAQSAYWDMETGIKSAEMRLLGNVTASYGTLMAVKRQRFKPIPSGVTDDFYLALSIVAQGVRFIYTEKAVAQLDKPSRDPVDEIRRRRRIVCRSLYCLSLWRELLHPGRRGWYAVCLWSHKILRRLAPVLFIIIFCSGLILGLQGDPGSLILLFAMIFGLGISALALGALIVFKRLPRLLRLPAYFLAGNLGMLMGLMDFARGRRVVMW